MQQEILKAVYFRSYPEALVTEKQQEEADASCCCFMLLYVEVHQPLPWLAAFTRMDLYVEDAL